MDDQADAAREYDRLRAELADFVLHALAERVAAGQEPQLSQALVDAIERRVDTAVAARVGDAQWPDPDAFADQVLAAAAARGGGDGAAGATRARRVAEGRAPGGGPRRSAKPGLSPGQWALVGLLGAAIIAAAVFFLLRWNAPDPETLVVNVATNTVEPAPDAAANQQVPPPGNAALPGSASGAPITPVAPAPNP